MNILGICSAPEIMEIMSYVKILIVAIRVIVPIIIVVTASIDLAKIVYDQNPDATKQIPKVFITRFIAAIFIFFVPTLVNVVLDLTGSRYGYEECITLATSENISGSYLTRAEKLVSAAEKSLSSADVASAKVAISKVDDEASRENLLNRLKVVEESIKKKQEEEKKKEEEEKAPDGTPIETGPGSGGNPDGTCKKNIALSSEPNPADPLTCWPNIINMNKFTFPVDSKGRKLGAFPSNYSSLPTQLTSYKTYSGTFIVPVTPVNSVYNFVYQHNGIDFMAYFGTPIYSPVDGTLEYSEWGHTGNTGGDETAYSLSILMDKPTNVNGKTIGTIFLTHMSGIRYRCGRGGCNRKVKKGELLGFVGNAAGSATTGGWAPHLHMSMYPTGKYDQGLMTNEIEQLYNLTSGMTLNAGG